MFSALDFWLPSWLRAGRAAQNPLGMRHMFFCVCDHFAPLENGIPGALEGIKFWAREWPRLVRELREAGVTPPKHTFFYRIDHYQNEVVEALAEFAATTGNEVEMLLPDSVTSADLRRSLLRAKDALADHGLLSRDGTGALRYAIVREHAGLHDPESSPPPEVRCAETEVLRDTGCYAEFAVRNRQAIRRRGLAYFRSNASPKSNGKARPICADRDAAPADSGELLAIQAPLTPNWRHRKFAILPKLEDGILTASNPPTAERLRLWRACPISVLGRPNWTFITLHTHGAEPENARMLLGEPMHAFHCNLAAAAARDPAIRFHHVTAREMTNIIHAAEAGHSGDPEPFRNFRYRA